MKVHISVVLITYNEEKNIQDCLESVKWADEIIVVDAFSTDKTVDIARGYTGKIFFRNWDNYSAQRNFGLSQVNNSWILFIDADERVSEALATEIAEKMDRENNDSISGYFIPRESFYLGRIIRHGEWFPDEKLRLIKKGTGKWVGPGVHERIMLEGKTGHLNSQILHYTYRDIFHHIEKFNHYSSIYANEAFKHSEMANLFRAIWHMFFRFINGYFIKMGFMDGFAGFVIAAMQSFEVFLRYAKLEELKRGSRPLKGLSYKEKYRQ